MAIKLRSNNQAEESTDKTIYAEMIVETAENTNNKKLFAEGVKFVRPKPVKTLKVNGLIVAFLLVLTGLLGTTALNDSNRYYSRITRYHNSELVNAMRDPNNSYSAALSEEVIRYVKNLERYFIHYADIDLSTATVDEIKNYNNIKQYLAQADHLRYALTNTATGEYYTNIDEAEWGGYTNPLNFVASTKVYYVSVDDYYFSIMFNGALLNETFLNSDITGYVCVPDYFITSSSVRSFFDERERISAAYARIDMFITVAFAAGACLFLLFLASDKSSVYKALAAVHKINLKMPLLIKMALGLISLNMIYDLYYISFRNIGTVNVLGIEEALRYILCTIAVLWLFSCGYYVYKIIKNPAMILNEFEIKWIKDILANLLIILEQRVTPLTVSLMFLVFSYITVQLMFAYLLLDVGHSNRVLMFIIGEIIINGLALYVYYLITALAKVNKYMDAIISGNIDEEISVSSPYKSIVNKLNRLRGGVRYVVNEKNKSDKMKAELITNVSHDLKTPLTSIINYIELLKTPNLSAEEISEYIDVLDKKSQRVKLLIDDLFEATKLSSGQIVLKKEMINIVDLIMQATGEFEQKLNANDITVKLTYSRDKIDIKADGKKIWRVFENLLSNIVKYSQKGTRAYVDISENTDFVIITFKNISYYEMNFEYDEIFERFKRGDAARSTDGSGLGLSIAKDIVALHNGNLDVVIDGDLFKTVITLPLR